MGNQPEVSSYYAELAEDVIRTHDDLSWLLTADVSIAYVKCYEEKKKAGADVYADCRVVRGCYQAFIPAEFIITVYEPNVVGLSIKQLKILLYHELLHVGVNEKGQPYTKPHDVEEFVSVIAKYGLDWAK